MTQEDVAAAARGDRSAFERLYRLHVARIHTLAVRIGGAGEADDDTQEVFLRAWSRLTSFRGEAAFGTWLYRLALNLLLDRSRGRAGGMDREAGELLAEPVTANRSSAVGLDLEQALARLPRGARQVFVLHDVEGLDHMEVGERLGVTVGTSKSQLHRARMLLRAALNPEESGS